MKSFVYSKLDPLELWTIKDSIITSDFSYTNLTKAKKTKNEVCANAAGTELDTKVKPHPLNGIILIKSITLPFSKVWLIIVFSVKQ